MEPIREQLSRDGRWVFDPEIKFTEGAQVATLKLWSRPNDDTVDRTITVAFGTGSKAPSAVGVVGGVHPLVGAVSIDIINDDDQQSLPELNVTAGIAQFEGRDVRFTVTANPAPAVDLVDVSVTVSQSGDYGVTTGQKTVTIPAATGSATLMVGTTSDDANEPDGAVTLTLDTPAADAGYTVSATQGAATAPVVDDDTPQVSIVGGSGVTEGGDASFTITADPTPLPDLDVSVTVSQSGDYGVATGQRTVTIPTTGSATFTVGTTNDDADEADGSVTVTLDPPAASANVDYFVSYVLATQATVTVADDDDPPPPNTERTACSDLPTISVSDAEALPSDRSADFCKPSRPVTAYYMHSREGLLVGEAKIARLTSSELDRTVSVEINGTRRLEFHVVYATGAANSSAKGLLSIVSERTSPVVVTPEISIVAGGDIIEGADATFALSASPAPTAALPVSVSVTASGDYGVGVATHTVTLPTSGAASLALPTTNDQADEADGAVTATLNAGNGYTVSSAQSSGTVTVADDDDSAPVIPVVSISAGADVTEGDGATFTVSAHPAPSANLAVSVTVSASGDYGATTGAKVVTIPTSGSATFTVGTTNDDTDEADGSVTATLDTPAADAGYTVSATQGAATVSVADDDDPPPLLTTPEVSVSAGSGVTEGGDASFTVTASPAPAANLDVSVTVSQSGDYGATTGQRTVTIPTAGSVTLTVGTTDDGVDEADGSVTATLDTPAADAGYTVSATQGAGTVSVADDDVPAPTTGYTADPQVVANVKVWAAETHNGAEHVNRWQRVLVSFGELDAAGVSGIPMTATEAQVYADRGWPRWVPVVAELTALEASQQDPLTTPEVSVSAGGGVTEGGDATFTITASPAPAADLDVSVTVSQSGDYGAATGQQTVTIPTTGSATLTVGTTNDGADEADGSVTATVNTGSDYTVSATQGAATVSVSDDDVPEISISTGSSVTEGGNASFTITASPAPAADLDVSVTVSQSGDYGAATGQRTVTIPTTGSATFTVGTTDDGADEADGSVTATVNTGSDYTVSAAQGAATVSVADDDDPAPKTGYTVDPQVVANVKVWVAETHNGAEHVNRWQRVLVAFGVLDAAGVSGVAMTAAEAQGYADRGWPRWVPVVAELTALEASQQDPLTTPEVSVTAGSGVTEGGNATFTVTASPAPAADLDVSVTVSQSGDYGAATGQRTVTIPTTGSATLTVSTTDDDADEADGSVTATLDTPAADAGYTVSATQGAATVTVTDDDDPPPPTTPEVSITAGGGVTEGGDASFTVTASPAPASSLDVSVTVSQSGDYGAATGQRTVTIPTAGSATFTVGTTDDGADEADGSVMATVNSGSGYTVSSSQGAATVSVADDDDPPPPLTTPEVSVTAGGGITEGGDASFTVTASPAPAADLDVSVTVSQSGDYGAATGQQTVTIPTAGSVTLTVGTTNDGADEVDGSVTATVNTGSGYTVSASQGAATVSVSDDDVPEVSISAGNGVTEGGDASFTVTASPVPASSLDLSVTVSQSGDYGAATGQRTVTIPTAGSVTLTVGTIDDEADEVDGSVTATVNTGSGYTVSASQGAATVTVADDDDAPEPEAEVSVTVEDASGMEGDAVEFRILLSHALTEEFEVRWFAGPAYHLLDDRAHSGDYQAMSEVMVFAPGVTELTGVVWLNDDSADEPDEYFAVEAYLPGEWFRPASVGTMTIVDDD